MTVSEPSLHDAVEQAIEDAREAYEDTTGGFPAGFAWLKNVDGRTRLARFLKHTELPVTLRTAGSTRVVLDDIGGQFLDPKVAAYTAFRDTLIEELDEDVAEEAENWSMYRRWD